MQDSGTTKNIEADSGPDNHKSVAKTHLYTCSHDSVRTTKSRDVQPELAIWLLVEQPLLFSFKSSPPPKV